MRLFVGSFVHIEGYEGIKSLFDDSIEGRWIPEKNLHLTFRFLGEVDDATRVIRLLEPLLYRRGERIAFNHFGCFGHKILYAASHDPVLQETALAVDTLLVGTRGEREKPFIPHVTLMKSPRPNPLLQEPLPPFPGETAISAELKVALIRSDLTPQGARYTMIREF